MLPAIANSLLLATHVPLFAGPNGLQIDEQTAAGLVQWCRHFDNVTFFGISRLDTRQSATSSSWVDVDALWGRHKLSVKVLPRAYSAQNTIRYAVGTGQIMRDMIGRHRYLCFTLGGLWGDWPALGCAEAIRLRRPFSAWIDRVEAHVIKEKLSHGSIINRAIAPAVAQLVDIKNKFLLSRSTSALLQGMDTFDYYQQFAPNPFCTYDTHTTSNDWISRIEVQQKRARVLTPHAPLRILYVGRAASMKGPMDWIEVLKLISDKGIPFEATWVGDGPVLESMKKKIFLLGLEDRVKLTGFSNNRAELFQLMRASDLFLFCHKTPESPRCLIEALVSGAALVGYDSSYPRGLVDANGGGTFVPLGNVNMLSRVVAGFHHNRLALANLLTNAALSGRLFSEDGVYEHRANIMKLA